MSYVYVYNQVAVVIATVIQAMVYLLSNGLCLNPWASLIGHPKAPLGGCVPAIHLQLNSRTCNCLVDQSNRLPVLVWVFTLTG
jgi:hypothetical protein